MRDFGSASGKERRSARAFPAILNDVPDLLLSPRGFGVTAFLAADSNAFWIVYSRPWDGSAAWFYVSAALCAALFWVGFFALILAFSGDDR